jgi:hypothetical protein
MTEVKLCTAIHVARAVLSYVEEHYAQLWSAKPKNTPEGLKSLVIAQCQRLTSPLQVEVERLNRENAHLRQLTEGSDIAMLRKRLNDVEAQIAENH